MLQYRTSTIKTQVRRLKYFTVIINSIGKDGIKKELLQNKIIDWNNDSNIENLKEYTGVISQPSNTLFSQSFKNYIEAALQWEIINSEFERIYFSRKSHVLKALLNEEKVLEKQKNTFQLNKIEKIFYLRIIFEKDADIFLTVLAILENEKEPHLTNYLSKFKHYYQARLISKTKKIDNLYKYELSDAINRVNRWMNPKRYSEDLVPSRCHWMLDLGFIDEYYYFKNKEYHLNDLAQILTKNLLNVEDIGIFDINSEWLESNFMNLVKNIYMNASEFKTWQNMDENSKINIFGEVLNLLLKYFRVLGMPTLSLEQSLLFSTLYFLNNHQIICEYNDLISWIGVNKTVLDKKIGVRKSTRKYESYLYIEKQ